MFICQPQLYAAVLHNATVPWSAGVLLLVLLRRIVLRVLVLRITLVVPTGTSCNTSYYTLNGCCLLAAEKGSRDVFFSSEMGRRLEVVAWLNSWFDHNLKARKEGTIVDNSISFLECVIFNVRVPATTGRYQVLYLPILLGVLRRTVHFSVSVADHIFQFNHCLTNVARRYYLASIFH